MEQFQRPLKASLMVHGPDNNDSNIFIDFNTLEAINRHQHSTVSENHQIEKDSYGKWSFKNRCNRNILASMSDNPESMPHSPATSFSSHFTDCSCDVLLKFSVARLYDNLMSPGLKTCRANVTSLLKSQLNIEYPF
ncbi:hypothetical protein HELRODRAFT_165446 [Helobdella robusta]|uniref:Uncharacterized protein n=1 Tax=Helobdella robusta TaxID=6412 RepID=T1EWT3_HELRO|nr:hypothetical protein HELRODRAFT_165446 [Helobdella robusta]ESN91413.1 hypothetical protein HELRODRAFT_165446 [Helobdella robusta]